MNIFFDTEFTGLHKDTTLISIGMVAENGATFYAEFNDYDKSQCDDWIVENVLSNCYNYEDRNIETKIREWESGVADKQIYGPKKAISEMLRDWLQQFDEVTFVSDVCHYDFVLLIDLFGSAFDLPKNVCPACHDINQDIAFALCISEKEAFDYSREEFAARFNGDIIDCKKHNSLYDAMVIRQIYNVIDAHALVKYDTLTNSYIHPMRCETIRRIK